MVFSIWTSSEEWCSQSFPNSRGTFTDITYWISLPLYNKLTCKIFLDSIQVLGDGNRLTNFSWISKASINCANSWEGATSSCAGIDCWGDISADVVGGSIDNFSGCSVNGPHRFLEEADSSIQDLDSSQRRLYRSDLLLALSMTLGCSFDQSLDHWYPLVVSAFPDRLDAGTEVINTRQATSGHHCP
jgi:hypothetical protein